MRLDCHRAVRNSEHSDRQKAADNPVDRAVCNSEHFAAYLYCPSDFPAEIYLVLQFEQYHMITDYL